MVRRSIIAASAFAVCFLVAGCGSTPATPAPTAPQSSDPNSASRGPLPPSPPAPPTSATCDATKVQWAIGEKASADLLERARVGAGAASARFVRPDEAITLEFLASRLTVGLDRKDIVTAVTCG